MSSRGEVQFFATDMYNGLVDPGPHTVFVPCDANGKWPDTYQTAVCSQWPIARQRFRSWFRWVLKRFSPEGRLGEFLCTDTGMGVRVATGVVLMNGELDVNAFQLALEKAAQHCVMTRSSLHLHLYNAEDFASMFTEVCERYGIDIIVYMLDGRKKKCASTTVKRAVAQGLTA